MTVNKSTGKESVWDYPRPPRLERTQRSIRVIHNGVVVADTSCASRVLETSHPPTYYIPFDDIDMSFLVQNDKRTMCEWKGAASYYNLRIGSVLVRDAAWTYLNPKKPFGGLVDHIAFYANKVDACFVDDERVDAQAGSFYGGWITSDIAGPFKGSAGTDGW